MGKLIVANWKMNPATVNEAVALAREEDAEGLVVCPPFPFIEAVGRTIKQATLGAQDAFIEPKGAYTGEVSPEELKSLGVQYVIIGHSERRRLGETDGIVAKKVAAVVAAGLTPILCVGENRAEHDAGKAEEVVKRQLEIGRSKLINSSTHQLINLAIAYEPVWAISTEPGAKADTPESAVRMIQFMKSLITNYSPSRWLVRARGQLPITFIYGGSVTAANAAAFLARSEIQGALVGGASLKPEEMAAILTVASQSG